MSKLPMTDEQRAELEAAQRQSRNVRHWKRYQAVLLRAAGMPVVLVAQTLGCTQTSVCNWTAAWRRGGMRGVQEGVHRGAARRLDATGEQHVEELLGSDPQAKGYAATGWTVALLQTELAKSGWQVGERTIRRTLHRLGWVRSHPNHRADYRNAPSSWDRHAPSSLAVVAEWRHRRVRLSAQYGEAYARHGDRDQPHVHIALPCARGRQPTEACRACHSGDS